MTREEGGQKRARGVADDFRQTEPFGILAPAQQRVPFVFNSPHSGRHYSHRFLSLSQLCGQSIRQSEDCYMDLVCQDVVGLGAPLLFANFPRSYIDANREPYELDPRMYSGRLPGFANIRSARVAGGLGTVPKIVGEGKNIYSKKLPVGEALDRIEICYKPYHAAIAKSLGDTRRQFGYSVLVDCHSMPSSVRVSGSDFSPDFIVGDRYGASAPSELGLHMISILESMGYSVSYNKPYAGGFITEHYGRPHLASHAIQIEINRRLYLDEENHELHSGFRQLRANFASMCNDLLAMPDTVFEESPLAAE